MSQKQSRGNSDQPIYRRRDQGKIVAGCDGYFEPRNLARTEPNRPGATRQDQMPKESRPRYQAWLKRQGK